MITVYFRPLAVGGVTGTLKVYDNAAGSPQQVGLTGIGYCTKQGGRCGSYYAPCCPGLRCVGFSVGNYCEPSIARLPYGVSPSLATGVYVVNRQKNVVTAIIPVSKGASALAIMPDGSKIYVADSRAHAISVIATRTNAVVKTMALPAWARPTDVLVARDGLMAYASDRHAGTVSIINTKSDTVESTIPDGLLPTTLAVLPRCSPGVVGSVDGSMSYVLNGTQADPTPTAQSVTVALQRI